jgi:hypothetical protein
VSHYDRNELWILNVAKLSKEFSSQYWLLIVEKSLCKNNNKKSLRISKG